MFVQLDMTPQGEFLSPPRGPAAPLTSRLLRVAILVAVLAGAMSLAALAFWLAISLIPVMIGAAAVAYGLYRYRLWQMRRGYRL